jgi:cytochrome P450
MLSAAWLAVQLSLKEVPMFPPDPIAAVTHPNPYPYYGDLAARRPVYRDETLGLWVAASAAAAAEALASENCRVRPPSEPIPRALLGSAAADIFGALVRMNDGAGHCPLKRAVSATFDSIDLSAAAARSRAWARELADELRPQDNRGRLADLAFRLPVAVIADLLGAARSQAPQFALWMGDFVGCLTPASSHKQLDRGKAAAAQLHDAVQALLDAQPLDAAGLLAALAREARRAGCDKPGVVVANAIGFMSQAYEATAGLIGNTLVALATQHGIRAQVLHNPDLLGHVVPEVLRYDPPIQNTRRFLAEDAMVAGKRMRAGDLVLVVLAAANRDPSANPQPERFELFRNERRTFTFGAGAHACPGAALAATIAQAGVAQLIASGLDLAPLVEAPTYRRSANARIPFWYGKGASQ